MHRYRYWYRYRARYRAHVLVLVLVKTLRYQRPIPRDVIDTTFSAETSAAATECQAQQCGNISPLMMTTHAWQTANFAPQKYQEEVQKAVLIIRVI